MSALRNTWSKQHAIGFAIGLLTVIIAIPIVAVILTEFRGAINIWHKLKYFHETQSQVLSLAVIPNLFWFHFFLKKELWKFAYGIIYVTFLALLIVITLKYFL